MTQEQDVFVRQSFESELNLHGFGFQFSVMKKVKELYQKEGDQRSRWAFLVSEFPVSIQGFDTRIDFVLASKAAYSTLRDSYMICECKRANPDYSNWCFIRAPYSYRNQSTDHLTIDHLRISDDQVEVFHHQTAVGSIRDRAYHLAQPVLSKAKGDSQAKSQPRGQIEDAVSQVLKGSNGLIETLSNRPAIVAKHETISFLPAIFTTANLWTSEDDISRTELETGKIKEGLRSFQRADWLWYQYNTSPGIKAPTVD